MTSHHEIRSILERADQCDEAVLGTLVDVLGSSYRLPGARVLITPSGDRFGLISGGCLEKDVARHAWTWTQDGPITALYDTRSDDVHPHGLYGSGCDGVVMLLLERIRPKHLHPHHPLQLLRTLYTEATRSSFACATIYSSSQNTPSIHTGKSIIWDRTTVHNPNSLPAHLIDTLTPHARSVLHANAPRPVSIDLPNQPQPIRALLEVFSPPPELLICGAGDDARPLYRMALQLGWRVCVLDKWPALVTPERFPKARLICAPPHEAIQHASPNAHTYTVLMTHNFEDDAALLPHILQTQTPWLGLMGPRRRTAKLMDTLLQRGLLPTPNDLERIQTPVGIDLGADAPEEVALSILGGLIAHRNQRSGGLLRTLDHTPIHPPHKRITHP